MKSLYIKPIKKEKNPIIATIYHKFQIAFISLFLIKSLSPKYIKNNPVIKSKNPCPMSPYMTPNKKGKLTI